MFGVNGVIGDGEWTCPHLGASRNVSFAVHRSTAGVFRAKVFGARFPTASWGGSADRIAAGANSMRPDAVRARSELQSQLPENADYVCVAPSSGQSPRARGNQTQIDVSATQTTYRSVGTAAHFVPPVEP